MAKIKKKGTNMTNGKICWPPGLYQDAKLAVNLLTLRIIADAINRIDTGHPVHASTKLQEVFMYSSSRFYKNL